MTMRLDDPRLAAEFAALVDARVRWALGQLTPQRRYGIVEAVDPVTLRASVRIGAAPTASPGFVYAGAGTPEVGDQVRVVIDGADRYVEAILRADAAGPPAYIGRGARKTAASFAVGAGAWTLVTGWGNVADPPAQGGAFAIPTSGVFTLDLAGYYVVEVQAAFNNVAAGQRRIIGVRRGAAGSPSLYERNEKPASGSTGDAIGYTGLLWVPTAPEDVAIMVFSQAATTLTEARFAVAYLGAAGPAALLRNALQDALREALPGVGHHGEAQPNQENGTMTTERQDRLEDAQEAQDTDTTRLDPQDTEEGLPEAPKASGEVTPLEPEDTDATRAETAGDAAIPAEEDPSEESGPSEEAGG